MIVIYGLIILFIIGYFSEKNNSSNKNSLSKYFLFIIIFIVLYTILFSSPTEESDCTPAYSQIPTQEQINAIEKAKQEGVYGDNYLLSKKVGCVKNQ